MRTLRFWIFLPGLFLTFLLGAQNPVFPVQVREFPLINPTLYLNDLSDMPFNAVRPMFELTLRDPVESSRDVYFRISVRENGGEVMATNPNAVNLPSFTLSRGVPRMITGMDLAPYFDLNNLIGRSGTGASNLLRPGNNEICLQIFDAQRQEPISSLRCARGIWTLLDPPLLALPANNATVAPQELFSRIFSWQMTDPRAIAFINTNGDILFDFELRELPPGMNPQDAFDNFIQIYTLTDLRNNRVLYSELTPLLEPGKTYAWRVRAKRTNALNQVLPAYFRNNGYSMVHTFRVSGESPIPTLPGATPGCDCVGANCTPTPVINQTPARSISENKALNMGFFQITDLRLSNTSGASLSGTGMVPLNFLDFKVQVRFNGLQVNDKGEVYGGEVRVDRNAASSLAVQAVNGVFTAVPVLTDADRQLLATLVESNTGTVPALPFSIRKSLEEANIPVMEGEGDLVVSDLYFTPTGAFMDLIAVIPDGKGDYIRFGASKVGLRPEGMDMSQLQLYLAEDMQIPGLGEVPLVIKKSVSRDTASGSFMSFDCNGFKKFNLVAEYIFPKEQLVRAKAPLADPVKASLVLTSTKWGQFLATASIPEFQLANVPEWSFEVKKATMDLDSARNVGGMVFPTYYAGMEAPSWKGFYVEELSVTLPKELRFGDTTAQPIKISTKNLLIDTSGVSGDLLARNILPMPGGDVSWGFSMDTLAVYFAENAFQAATINGGAKIGVLGVGANIGYEGLFYEDPETESYAFDLIPSGEFDINWLKVKARIEEESYITIRKPEVGAAYRPYAEFNMAFNFNIGSGDIGEGPIEELLESLNLPAFSFGIDLNVLGLKINHPDLDGPPKKYVDMTCMCGSSMYVTYGADTTRMGITDILKSDSILNESGILVPGIGLEFKFEWLDIAGISLEILTEEHPGGPEFGFKFPPRFKLNFDADFIDNLEAAGGGIINAAKNFKCQCEGTNAASAFCTPPSLNGTGDLAAITNGKTLQAAHFPVTVTDWNAKKGKVSLPYLGLNLELDLQNISAIDREGKLAGGRLGLAKNSVLSNVSANANGGLDFKPGFNLATLRSVAGQLLNGSALITSLPFSIKAQFTALQLALPDSSDIVVTDLYFTQDSAAMDVLIIIPDFQGGYLRFGASGIRIRPDGIDLGKMLVFLAEDTAIPGLKNLPLTIKKSEDRDSTKGSFISFDCKGFKAFNLVATYTFDEDQLVAAGGTMPLVASLQLRGSKWGQFLATATIPEFQLADVPEWSFEVIKATMDLDSARNVEGMVFPTFYAGSEESSWKGFYVEELSVTLPKELRFGDTTNTDPIQISANNLLIDTSGVSGDLLARNILPMPGGEVNWGFSIDSLAVYFAENAFQAASINGGAKIGVLGVGANIGYEGLFYEDPETESYAFDLIPSGEFDIDWLKVKARIEPESYITIRKPEVDSAYRPYAELNLHFNFELSDSDFGDLSAFKNALQIQDLAVGINVNVLGLKINHPDLDGPPKKYIDMVCMCGSNVYFKYGNRTDTLTVQDILKADSVLNAAGSLVPGLSLEFKFAIPLAEISIEASVEQERDNTGNFKGFGSPKFNFKYKLDQTVIDAAGAAQGLGEAIANFTCSCPPGGIYCSEVNTTGGASASIGVNDSIKVGHFDMKVKEINGGQGKGIIRVPFLKTDINVNFSGITVVSKDGKKFLVTGEIKTDSSGPASFESITINQNFLQTLASVSNNVKQALTLPISARELLGAVIKLPDNKSDFIFLGLSFEPTRATARAMVVMDFGNNKYAKLGIDGFNIRPDGFNMDELKFFLAQDFSF